MNFVLEMMQIICQNPQLDFSSQTKSLSVGSSLLVLLSDGLIPLQQKPIGLPTNAESQAGHKQGNEGSLWQISPGMRSISMSIVRNVHSLLPLLCPHSPAYKTCCRDLRLKGWSSQRPQDVHEEVLPPNNVSAPYPSDLPVGLGKHGSASRNEISTQLKSNGNL